MSSTARSNRLTQVVVEAIVALGVVMAALTGLGYLIGPNGAGLVHGKPGWPLIGPGQYSMTVETELDTDVTITGAPTTTETTSGTVDAATGQRPAAIGRPITATVEFDGPTAGQRWAWAIWQAAGPLLSAFGLGIVLVMLRSARREDPFDKANLRRLQALTFLVLVGGTLVSWGGAFVRRWLLDNSAVADIVPLDFHFSFLPIIGGVLLAMLTEVWRRGVAMRTELEGLI